MPHSWARALSATKSHHHHVWILSRITSLHAYCTKPFKGEAKVFPFSSGSSLLAKYGLFCCHFTRRDIQTATLDSRCYESFPLAHPHAFVNVRKFCSVLTGEIKDEQSDFGLSPEDTNDEVELNGGCDSVTAAHEQKLAFSTSESVDFTKIAIDELPTVLIVGRPNVGKSALFNRLIRRREALVYNTPADHVTRDIRDGVAKLGDLRFKVLDSAGLEAEATAGSVLQRTAEMTGNVLARSQFALFLIDARLVGKDTAKGTILFEHSAVKETSYACSHSRTCS